MAKYSSTNGSTTGGGTQQNCAAAYTGAVLGVTGNGTSPRRGKVYDVLIGTNNTPGDTFVEWDISRVTASSTATILTALPLDPADAACNTVATVNSSTFATIGNPAIWYVGVNQRASYRWVAAPGGELVWPATASNGFQLRVRGSYASTVTGTWNFEE